MFAAIASDVTIPIAGYAQGPNGLNYRTELVITNYRDRPQYIEVSTVNNGYDGVIWISPIDPLETRLHCCDSMLGDSAQSHGTAIGALRFRTLARAPEGGPGAPDPEGRIEVNAFIVADRGRFGTDGSSRQEIAGIPASEYTAEEAVFLGVRHSPNTGTYTNVGIVNMHPTQTETFYVQFQRAEPVAVVVPPSSLRQIRIPGDGGGWRALRVYPEWAIGDGPPARTTPWVAYASSIDMQTGDAFSGLRVPPGTRYDFPGPD
jgi:hypothetical protein